MLDRTRSYQLRFPRSRRCSSAGLQQTLRLRLRATVAALPIVCGHIVATCCDEKPRSLTDEAVHPGWITISPCSPGSPGLDHTSTWHSVGPGLRTMMSRFSDATVEVQERACARFYPQRRVENARARGATAH